MCEQILTPKNAENAKFGPITPLGFCQVCSYLYRTPIMGHDLEYIPISKSLTHK